jgi:hypothetical protein
MGRIEYLNWRCDFKHFHFWKQSSWREMQLDGQFSLCLVAVECPASMFKLSFHNMYSTCNKCMYGIDAWRLHLQIHTQYCHISFNILCTVCIYIQISSCIWSPLSIDLICCSFTSKSLLKFCLSPNFVNLNFLHVFSFCNKNKSYFYCKKNIVFTFIGMCIWLE